jgi:hypothetical protein
MRNMNEIERGELASCERIIGRTKNSFIECGAALLRIRDRRLYKGTHKNFDDYCKDKWGFGKTWAYQLIAGAKAELENRPPEVDKNAADEQEEKPAATSTTDAGRHADKSGTQEREHNPAASESVGGGADSGDASGRDPGIPASTPLEEHHASNGEQQAPIGSAAPDGDLQPGDGPTLPSSGNSAGQPSVPEPAGVDASAARVTPAAQSRRSKPAHSQPMPVAAETFQRSTGSLAELADDHHNGGDLADYLLTSGADVEVMLADLERAVEVLSFALAVARQKARVPA